MELRKRKWIYNQLPKYDIGKPFDDGTTAAQITTKNLLALPSSYNAPSFGYDVQTGVDLSGLGNQKSTEWVDEKAKSIAANTPGNRALNSIGSIATNAINFTGSVINANTLGRSTGEILADAGSRNVNTGEFSW